MTWRAPILEAQENFLDALHTHRVHPGLVRRDAARRPVTVTAAAADDGFRVDYEGQSDQSGLLFRLFESRRRVERAHFSGLSVAQLEYGYAAGWSAFITLAFAPIDAATTRVFAMLHVTGRRAPAVLVRAVVWPFLRTVARQDARILAFQSHGRERFLEHRHVVTPLDIVRASRSGLAGQAAARGGDPPHAVSLVLYFRSAHKNNSGGLHGTASDPGSGGVDGIGLRERARGGRTGLQPRCLAGVMTSYLQALTKHDPVGPRHHAQHQVHRERRAPRAGRRAVADGVRACPPIASMSSTSTRSRWACSAASRKAATTTGTRCA